MTQKKFMPPKMFYKGIIRSRQNFEGHVPPNRKLFGGKLFGGTVPPNSLPLKGLPMRGGRSEPKV